MTSPRRRRRGPGDSFGMTRSSAVAIIGAFVALAFLVSVNLQTTAQAARVQTRPCTNTPSEDVDEAPSCAQLRKVVAQLAETNRQLVEAQKEIARLRQQLTASGPIGTPKPTPTPSRSTGPPGSSGSSSSPEAGGTRGAPPAGGAPSSSSTRPGGGNGSGGGAGNGGGQSGGAPAPPTLPPVVPSPTAPPVLPSPGRTCVVNVLGICVQVNNDNSAPLGGVRP